MSDKATMVASLNILGRLSVLHHIGTKHNFCCEKPGQFSIMTYAASMLHAQTDMLSVITVGNFELEDNCT